MNRDLNGNLTKSPNNLRNQFRGCILGTAIGDALGMPTEGMKIEEIRRVYGYVDRFHPSPTGDLKEGEWTDDTEQMIILSESIIDKIYLDPVDFSNKLIEWSERAFRIRTGPTTRQALYNLLRGASWEEAGVDSATCGAGMRSAPIGLTYHFNLNLVEKYAIISASVTHKNNSAIAGAIATSIAVACILLDYSDEELLNEVTGRIEKYDNLLSEKIRYSWDIQDESLNLAVEKLGNSIMTWDVIPMAFYSYFSSENFYSTVLKGANAGGDTDSISAVAGAMAGAKYGEKSIPEIFLKNLKDVGYLREIADGLYETHKRIVQLS